MASDLLLCVLGPLRLMRDEQEIDVVGSRQREVLARLAVAGGKPVSAEALLADLWGPVAAGSAAASLHVSISKLRRAIDPDREARASSPIVSTTGGYALAVGTDTAEVETRARRASTLLASGDPEAAFAELARARAAWRGEPYEWLGEQAWLVHERRRCVELRLYISELYAETSLRLDRDAAGIVVDLTGLAQRHPTHERLVALLAVALYRQGRQDEALGVLRATREHLRDESGLDPGPDLLHVEQLIRAQEPDPYAAAPRPTRTATRRPVPVAGIGYPLVGRDRPRAVLDAAAQAAESGHATTVVLIGEAGIGKTRLARSLADDLVSRGWRAVWSHGTEDDGAPALWPWLSIVRDLARVVPLAPELQALVESGSSGARAEPAADRWRQTQRIGELLDAASLDAPLLVLFDDLHLADAASQALPAELAARSPASQLLVLVTSRSTGSPGLTAVLARLARLGVVRLELDALTESDVRALAAAAGLEVDPRVLRERTSGNPFLLQETLAFAAESGASPLDVVPATVADVLGARMARLPPPGEHVLLVASVLGSVIEPALIAQLAELDPDLVDDGLDAALAADLLRVHDGGALRFRHDLVRETANGRLGAVRRSRLHARALALLKASGRLHPTLLAAHARDAGPALAEEAVRWSTAAAAEATARHAPESALHWWRTAYAADTNATVPDAGRRVAVLLGLVRAQLDAGDAVGAIETRAEAVQAASDGGDGALVVAALTSLDGALVWLPRPMGQINAAMIQLLERALTSTPAPSPAERCLLLASLALETYSPANAARCDVLTREALDIAERVGDPRTLAVALNARVLATAFPGRERERAEVAERLVEVGRTSDLPSFELAGHQLTSRLRLQLFEVRTADAHAAQARTLIDHLRLPLPAMQQRLWDCSRRALDGDVADSLRIVDEVGELDWPWWGRDAMLATVRLTLLLRAGLLDEAAPLLDLAAQVNPRIAADAKALVLARSASGSVVAREDTLSADDWSWLSSGCIHAQSVLALGDRDAIAATYDLLLRGSGMIAATGSFDAGPVDGYLADLAAALGRTEDERHHRELLADLCAREGLAS